MKRMLSKKKEKKEPKEPQKPVIVDVNGSSGMAQKERDVLDSHFPRLQKVLNAKNVLKHLRRNGEIGAKEEESILKTKGGKSSKGDQVLMLVDYLKRRQDGFAILITALLQSKSQDHVAEELLNDANFTRQEVNEKLETVEKKLDNPQKRKLQKFREETLAHQGPPRTPERNDSLLSETGSEYSIPSTSSYPEAGSLRHDDSGFVNNEVFSDKQAFVESQPGGDEQGTRLLDNIIHTLSEKTDLGEVAQSGWSELYTTENERDQTEEDGASSDKDQQKESHPATEDQIPSADEFAPTVHDHVPTVDEEIPTVPTAESPIIEDVAQDADHMQEEAPTSSFENGEQFETQTSQKDEEEDQSFLEGRTKHSSLDQLPIGSSATDSQPVETNKAPKNGVATEGTEGNQSGAIFMRRNTFPRVKYTESSQQGRGLADIKVRSVLESIKELRQSTLRLEEKLQNEHQRLDQMRRDVRRMLAI